MDKQTEREARRNRIKDVSDSMFRHLGIRVDGDNVVTLSFSPKYLGPAKGAIIEMSTPGRPFRVTAAVAGAMIAGPIGLLCGIAPRQASAFVIFADGSYHEVKLRSAGQIRNVELEAIRFRLLPTVRV